MQGKGLSNVDKAREKARQQKEYQTARAEERIQKMTDEEVMDWLKQKALPTFGTRGERLDRIRKAMNIPLQSEPSKDKLLKEIERIKQKREDRRAEINQIRKEKVETELENEKMGRKGDVDFARMIEAARHGVSQLSEHSPSAAMKLCVCVRKRPIFAKELAEGENDCLSVANPEVKVFDCKLKIDGITKYVDTQTFRFDNAFNEKEDTQSIYDSAVRPILEEVFQGGMVTLCAYGQTGSGKTFTMKALQRLAVGELFGLADARHKGARFALSFFEIYGGRCFDLLAGKTKVQILEDKNNNVVIQGLSEREVFDEKELLEALEFAFDQRTTCATTANDSSSRSHAVCQISMRREGVAGKLVVVDLAGSERAQDTTSNDRQRRLEGAEINKSLLALKECIRAMDSGSSHVPFRASKLTMALRDSFVSRTLKTRVVMVACLCPSSSSADHTLNTLRYADRLKGKKLQGAISSPAIPEEPLLTPVTPVTPVTPLPPIRARPNSSSKRKDPEAAPRLPGPKSPVPAAPKPAEKHKEKIKREVEDLRRTIHAQLDEPQAEADQFLTFHDKIGDIIEIHDELLALHLNVIREDAQLLSKESEIIAEAQHQALETDVEKYVDALEDIVRKKLGMYKQVAAKVKKFKQALKEEEEFSKHIKGPLYY